MLSETLQLLDIPATPSEEVQKHTEWLLNQFEKVTDVCNKWTENMREKLNDSQLSILELERELLSAIRATTFIDESGQPDQPYSERPLQIAALLNFMASHEVKRKDGNPYTAHPMFVDLIISWLGDKNNIGTRIRALLHDLVEEDTFRLLVQNNKDPEAGCITPDWEKSIVENMKMARLQLNKLIPEFNPGDAALELMAPIIPDDELPDSISKKDVPAYKQALFIYWLNWRAKNQKDVRIIKLADKIHDSLDLDYISNNEDKTKKEIKHKLETKFAKIFFSVYHLMHDKSGTLQPDVPKHLWNVFSNLINTRLKSFSIDTTEGSVFYVTFMNYRQFYLNHKGDMEKECIKYAREVGLSG